MSDEPPTTPATADRARSFGSVAEAYDRGRPTYPAEAVAWLAGGEAKVVLELGRRHRQADRELVDQGHAVFATEPDEAMLEVLRQRVPEVSAKVATAEEIPANDRSVDVVVVAQAFHWFDHEAALPEIARVLKPGGHVALVWNSRDERIPWVRRMGDLLGRQDLDTSSAEQLVHSDLFGFMEEATFKHWQEVNRETILDMARSRSSFAMMDEAERERHLADVLAFYDDYGRGMDGMQIPYVTRCYRAVVVDRDEQTTSDGDESVTGGTGRERRHRHRHVAHRLPLNDSLGNHHASYDDTHRCRPHRPRPADADVRLELRHRLGCDLCGRAGHHRGQRPDRDRHRGTGRDRDGTGDIGTTRSVATTRSA